MIERYRSIGLDLFIKIKQMYLDIGLKTLAGAVHG